MLPALRRSTLLQRQQREQKRSSELHDNPDTEVCPGSDAWGDSVLSTTFPKFAERFDAKRLFCTWPHCAKPKELVLQEANAIFPIKQAVVAEETHKCGHKHLHAYFHFNKRVKLRNHEKLDRLGGKHGSYETAKGSLKSILIYLTKEDKDPAKQNVTLEGIEDPSYLKGGNAKEIVANCILEGQTVDELIQEFPGVAMNALGGMLKLEENVKRINRNIAAQATRDLYSGFHVHPNPLLHRACWPRPQPHLTGPTPASLSWFHLAALHSVEREDWFISLDYLLRYLRQRRRRLIRLPPRLRRVLG